jgi:mannitol-1-phosphate 5-dehydrogenase
MRKLSRHERFIGPAAELAERGMPAWDLLNAVGAALRFDVPADEESVQLQELLSSGLSGAELAVAITDIDPDHPLFPHLVEVIQLRLNR